jgi:DNA-binding transcriptional LysR family regulator
MNLRQVEIFCAVMRCRTTVAAAFELGVSQPAVSSAVRQLETRLGVTLFDRIGRRLVPTVEANALYNDAQPLYAMSQAMVSKMRDLRDTKRGHFRVLATHALGRSLVAGALASFVKRRADVMVYFDVRPMEGVVEAVESGFADIGLALVPAMRPSFAIEPIVDGRMVVALPLGHRLAKRNSLRAQDLEGEPIVGLEPASRLGHLVRQNFESAGALYAPTIEVRHCLTACSLVEHGVGIAIVDEFSAARSSGWHLDLRAFEPELRISACVMHLRDKPLSRLAASFISELRRQKRSTNDRMDS